MNPHPPQALDLLRFPLWGSRLVEASAGTGKTWTIAALMLRLVLGHGEGGAGSADPARTGFGRPLAPAQVLVMTFTRAATRELADRIRARLLQAARCFRGEPLPADDSVLQALLAAMPDDTAREAAAGRLALAAESMDEAAVHTLDAWCQRMLREHAFDSGCLFDEELLPSEAELLQQAARDHWRCHVQPLDDAGLAAVTALWPGGPDDLARDVAALRQALPEPDADPLANDALLPPLHEPLQRTLQARAVALADLKAEWAVRGPALRAWLLAQVAPQPQPAAQAKSAPVPWNRSKLNERYFTPWMDALAAWAAGPDDSPPEISKKGWERLSPEGLADAWKGSGPVPVPPEIEALQALRPALRALPDPALPLRLHALAGVGQRLRALKAGSQRFGFTDLLHRLDAALDDTRPGRAADAQRLRQRILAQYPVAIVDEFQDTSPVQLRILDRLYRVRANDPDTALLLIGDPKQSIYAFRGADIRSYLQARQATAGRHHVLDTNFRSTHAAVAAVNHLFGQAETRPGGGAFGHRTDATGAGAESALPFVPVHARGRSETLTGRDGPLPGLQLCLDETPTGAGAARRAFAAHCAAHVVTLLRQAHFERDGQATALRPADIAVLVRSRTEAAAVRQALQRLGVASVYLSDQDSVFASAEAADLLRLLQAVADPRDARLARAALATGLLDLPLATLRRLAQDDDAFDTQVQHLLALQATWRRQGVLAMLRQALHRLDLPRRLLARDDVGVALSPQGERRLTNVRHLAELLQQAAAGLDGEQALLRWLAAQIDTAGNGLADDEQVLRLESDADRVQVVTVHKSKGLEYPVVCLPFAAHVRAEEGRRGWLRRATPAPPLDGTQAAADAPAAAPAAMRPAQAHADLPGAEALAWLDLAPDDDAIAAADAERLREDLRLLYVALTRARHHTWVGAAVVTVRGAGKSVAPATVWHRSALGVLASGPQPVSPPEVRAALHGLAQGQTHTVLHGVGREDLAAARALPRWQPPAAAQPLQPPLVFDTPIDRQWQLASFSALVRDLAAPPAEPLASALVPAQVRDDEPVAVVDAEAAGWPADDAAAPAEADDPGAALADQDLPSPGMDDAEDGLDLSFDAGASPEDTSIAPWHRFPRGPGPGNLLHELLEQAALQGFASVGTPAFAAEVQQRCARHGHADQADAAHTWLQAVVHTPLPPLAAPLAGLQQVLPEMEFWLPNPALDTAALDALCQAHWLPGVSRPPLPARSAHGLVMGYADLVVQHQGRWWVLDHKSNALGDDDASYDMPALHAAVAAHRYDVQAALYLLALHRLLRQRLGAAYDPAAHLGGAVFLFLRGLRGPQAGCCTLPATPALLQALDALLPLPAALP
jgi:exodeoxyribonuclease V beta subunit